MNKRVAAFFVLVAMAVTGYRGADLSYTWYRLHYYGQTASGLVTDRQVRSGFSSKYLIHYTFLGSTGDCPVSSDSYRSCSIDSQVEICYDPDNLGRSWLASGSNTLLWGAVLFDSILGLMGGWVLWYLFRP